ncbi:MAG: tetratricopeptide repeat protein [Deltaproteobacteria bacterium]|nr:tetratricopeptide repeat protein [Deltaproteobacteria bacterium]
MIRRLRSLACFSDPSTLSRVVSRMDGKSRLLSILLVAACAGGSQKGPQAPASQGTVTYQDVPGAQAPQPATPPQDVEPEGVVRKDNSGSAENTPSPQPQNASGDDGVKLPGQDMTPEKRTATVQVHLKEGTRAVRGRDTDTAIREARAALDVDETNVAAMLVLAEAYYLKEYDDKAHAILEIAKTRPEGKQDATLWMLLGLIHDRSGMREDAALAAYEKATELKPSYAAPWANRGAIYLGRRRYSDAISALETVVRLQGRSARAHANLGSSYRGRAAELGAEPAQRDQYLKKAESEYKLAMTQDPAHAPAYFNLGLLYLDADPFPGAETLSRLQTAMKYLNEYKRIAGSNVRPNDPVDEHLAAAQKAYDREVKRLERKKKKDAEKKKEAEPQKAEGQPAPPPDAPPGAAGEGTPENPPPAEGGGQ